MVYLSGVIGERTAGSEAEERAALYILGKFESWGLDARLQTFRQPVCRARSAHIWTEGEKPLYLSAKSVVFGGTTPPEGVIGELVDLGTANEAQLAFAEASAPARTLRFIALGGHETGLHGSEAYLRAHREQVENIVAVINFDAGHGTTLGTDSWVAAGPDEWIRFVKAVTDDSDLEPEWAVGTYYSDDTNFAALEVPTVNFDKGLSRIGRHTPKDNLKWTSPVGLQGGLLMSAMILEKISRDTSLTFPHQFPGDLIERVRNYAARYGWGIRPEANRPPRETRDQP